jgi:hypothetical protein
VRCEERKGDRSEAKIPRSGKGEWETKRLRDSEIAQQQKERPQDNYKSTNDQELS